MPNQSIESLRAAFGTEQICLEANLRSSGRISHHGDAGEVNEQFFIDYLRLHLPNRYTVEKAIVIDSRGDVSDSIDIVVFDRQYAPTLLDSAKHRYVPAEAVYAVFECKPTINKTLLDYAGAKAASVRALTRTSVSIHHAGGVYEPKTPGPIIAGILALDVDWSGGLSETFKTALAGLQGDHRIDCGFAAAGSCFDTFQGTDPVIGGGPTSLAFFTFRLLSKLQSLATAPAANWLDYAGQLGAQEES